MAINMAKTIQEERLRWILPLVGDEIRLVDMMKVCPHSRRSVLRWKAEYLKYGVEGLAPKSTRPRTNPKETPIHIKEEIISLRKKRRICALKLSWELKDRGVRIHPRTIGKIIKKEGMTRKYRVKRMKYKYIKVSLAPGELVEIDVKYVPGKVEGMQYFQYTAIDCASRWRYLRIFEEQGKMESIEFLKEVIERFQHRIRAVKTDNHSIFTNWSVGANRRSDGTVKTVHVLDRFCAECGIVHYLIDPGKPAQNGKVERSHRSDQESFYDRNSFFSPSDLKRKLRIWNNEYNDLAHCSLNGRSPNQFLSEYSKL